MIDRYGCSRQDGDVTTAGDDAASDDDAVREAECGGVGQSRGSDAEERRMTSAPATMQRPTTMQSAKRNAEESDKAEAVMPRSGA
jgi:hypothetical protein